MQIKTVRYQQKSNLIEVIYLGKLEQNWVILERFFIDFKDSKSQTDLDGTKLPETSRGRLGRLWR